MLSKSEYEEYSNKFQPLYVYYGAPDREKYYFRRAILGMDRVITWLASRPDFDGRHLVVNGSSQGGGFSLITAGYYDAVNFARKISPRVPVIKAVGFIDTTCCPSSVYSAFHVLQGAKRIFPGPDTGHGTVIEFEKFKQTWMKEQLGL